MKKEFLLLSFSIILLSNLVSAGFGVSSPCDSENCYWEGKPLILKQGESREVSFGLQTTEIEKTKVNVELMKGDEIAAFIDEETEYLISKNEKAKVKLKISIPENAEPGKEYKVSIIARQLPSDEGGMVQFSTSIAKSFDVLIEGEKTLQAEKTDDIKDNLFSFPILLLIFPTVLVFAIILYLIFKRKRKKR